MKSLLSIFLLLIFTTLANSQVIYSFKGNVRDSVLNIGLANATVFIQPINKGVVCDMRGQFNVQLPAGLYEVKISYVGYKTIIAPLELKRNTKRTFLLAEKAVSVSDINITAEKNDDNIKSIESGTLKIDSKDIKALPSLMGEPDIINALKLTPGIHAGGEGNPGLYVRGGDAGQNLILLDNMTLYNPSHLLGFFPVFNADIVSSAKIIKGGIPAQYGGRVSSVIDIKMKEGSATQAKASGSMGLLAADLTIEAPINKGRGSVIISGRRTYLEAVKFMAKPFIKSSENFFSNTNYYFFDASIKIRYNLSPKTRFFVSAFGGSDSYALGDDVFKVKNEMQWTNAASAIRLNHSFSERFNMDISTSLTDFNYGIDAAFNTFTFDLFSDINDWKNNLDFNYITNNKNSLKFGASYTKHILTPNKIDVDAGEIKFKNANKYYSNEVSFYFNSTKNITSAFSLSGGLRATYYEHTGPYTDYKRNEFGQLYDSTKYSKSDIVESYITADPNLNWVYILNEKSSIKGSASIIHQFMHLASVASVSLPTDVWLPSTNFIKPQKVWQVSSGYFRNFKDNTFESSAELYYKKLANQVDFLNGVLDNFDNTKIERNILLGDGIAYGAEFFFKKKQGRTTGWVSYTLSRTLRKFNKINDGNYYPAKYDRVHDFSVTLNHKLNERWNLSAVFVYSTGNALTLPAGRYIIQGNVANHYTDVNSFRMPAYHRLDISANYSLKQKGRFKSNLNFSIYNVYNRSNPYFIYFAIQGDLDNYHLNVAAKQISLFPILPSITWSFNF